MSLDQANYIFEIICKKKKQKKNNNRSQHYGKAPKKKVQKNISFCRLKTNTELQFRDGGLNPSQS